MAYNFTQYQEAARGGYAARLKSTMPYYAPLNQTNLTDKFSRSTIPSSTPHAPRQLINQYGHPIPQKRQIRHHRLLDTNVFKSISAPNLLLDKDEQLGNAATAAVVVGKFSTDQKQQTSSKAITKPPKVTTQVLAFDTGEMLCFGVRQSDHSMCVWVCTFQYVLSSTKVNRVCLCLDRLP